MGRKVADCRDFPSETGCTLTICGTESEVVQAAAEHAVSTHGHVDCTCPDSTITHAVCKHIRALQVLNLVAKTAKPSIQIAWENTQPSRRRKPPVPGLSAPVPAEP